MYITVNDIRHVCVLTCISTVKRSIWWYQLLQPSHISVSHVERNTKSHFQHLSGSYRYIDKTFGIDCPYRCYAYAFFTLIPFYIVFSSSVIYYFSPHRYTKHLLHFTNNHKVLWCRVFLYMHVWDIIASWRSTATNWWHTEESDFSHRLSVSDYVCRFRVYCYDASRRCFGQLLVCGVVHRASQFPFNRSFSGDQSKLILP